MGGDLEGFNFEDIGIPLWEVFEDGEVVPDLLDGSFDANDIA